MSIYYPNGCTSPGPYPCNQCPPIDLGRVRGVFFLASTYTFTNISNPAEWDTLICNGTVFIVPFTNGSMSSAPKESNGFGNIDKVVDSFEYTIEGTEPNVLNSAAWWDSMRTNYSYTPGWVTQSSIWLAAAPALVIPHIKVDDDMQSRIVQGFTIKWVQAGQVLPKPIPVGTFAQCIEC